MRHLPFHGFSDQDLFCLLARSYKIISCDIVLNCQMLRDVETVQCRLRLYSALMLSYCY